MTTTKIRPEPHNWGDVWLCPGDCLRALPTIKGVDAVVTDPPYYLASIVKRFGSETSAPAKSGGATGVYGRASSGFMGQKWDGGDIAFRPETWRLVYDSMKPGAHLAAFSSTRTYHRMATAIEDAGFEVRDMVSWLYGSGFPKSLDVSKALDKRGAHDAKAWNGWGTALKPACEPIVLARKPLIGTVAANVLEHGTGGINVDGCRVPYAPDKKQAVSAKGRWPANVVHDGSEQVIAGLGSSARFFYHAKANAADRAGSKHPTVKPVALMRWLVRLITPPGGLVLDPFAGTGTTGEAARLEGMRAILIEIEPRYQDDIYRRLVDDLGYE